MNKTIAIVVNFENYIDTIETVNSLLEQVISFYKIVIIDNCSQNNSFLELESAFKNEKDVVILKTKTNGGFAYGNNFGLKYCLENYDFDFFMMINNDVKTGSELNSIFIEYYNSYNGNDLGLLTGKIYYYDFPNKIWFAGGKFSKLKSTGYHIGNLEEDRGQFNNKKEIEFATGCLWFFHKKLLSQVGYLPEEYFMYLEDVDYCINIKRNNLKIIYIPEVAIWHKIGASSGNKVNSPKFFYDNRNRIILSRKYLSRIERIYFMIFLFINRTIWYLKLLIKFKKNKNTFEGIWNAYKK